MSTPPNQIHEGGIDPHAADRALSGPLGMCWGCYQPGHSQCNFPTSPWQTNAASHRYKAIIIV